MHCASRALLIYHHPSHSYNNSTKKCVLGNCPTWCTNSFQCIYLFIVLSMFRACHAHHQEKQIVSIQLLVIVTPCWWQCRVLVGSKLVFCTVNKTLKTLKKKKCVPSNYRYTGIRSEKCVVRRFRRCANMYLHKPR